MSYEEEVTEAVNAEGEEEETLTSFPVEGLEVTVQMLDLWNEVLRGNISLEEFKETMKALQSLATPKTRRRRRRR